MLFSVLCQFSGRIIGGVDAESGDWPWQGSLQWKADGDHICGVAVIGNQHVLTGANCMSNPA